MDCGRSPQSVVLVAETRVNDGSAAFFEREPSSKEILMKPALAFACALLWACAASSCSSEPTGPVTPTVVDSPATAVVVHPDLQHFISVPANPEVNQVLSWTEDGRLRFDFSLQNKTNQTFWVKAQATFYRQDGVPADTQMGQRYHFSEYQIVPIRVICSNTDGKTVKVQVMPAN